MGLGVMTTGLAGRQQYCAHRATWKDREITNTFQCGNYPVLVPGYQVETNSVESYLLGRV
jgi:hypothetical protein